MKASGKVKHINEPRRGFVLACFLVIYSCRLDKLRLSSVCLSILPL